jgi:hypothetical protein
MPAVITVTVVSYMLQVGGCYNGLVAFFDLRKPGASTGQCAPLETSVIEKSHHDPGLCVLTLLLHTALQHVTPSSHITNRSIQHNY